MRAFPHPTFKGRPRDSTFSSGSRHVSCELSNDPFRTATSTRALIAGGASHVVANQPSVFP